MGKIFRKDEVLLLIFVSVFAVHMQAYIGFFYNFPSFIRGMSSWSWLGVLSYLLLAALIEALLYVLGTVVVSILLPEKLFRKRMKSQGSLLILSLFILFLPITYYQPLFSNLALREMLLFVAVFLLLQIVIGYIMQRFPNIETRTVELLESVIPLSLLFLLADTFAIIIVVLRNSGLLETQSLF